MHTTVFVSIGRNVGADPLPQPRWDSFQGRVASAISATGADILGTYLGFGEWEGVSEESSGWLALVPNHQIGNLRYLLHQKIGLDYGQESVGFTVHGANPWPNSYTGSD